MGAGSLACAGGNTLNRGNLLRREGQALVEFCIALPVVLVLLYALFDVSRLMFIQLSLDTGAQAASRLLSMNQAGTTRLDVYQAVLRAAPGVEIRPDGVSFQALKTSGGEDLVEVTVQGEYAVLSAFYVTRNHRIQLGSISRNLIHKDRNHKEVRLP